MVQGAAALDNIQDNDKIQIAEGCTHHRQCDDIGTVKIPNWIRSYTKKEPEFVFTSGTEFPGDLKDYKLVVHCGGWPNEEMKYRLPAVRIRTFLLGKLRYSDRPGHRNPEKKP